MKKRPIPQAIFEVTSDTVQSPAVEQPTESAPANEERRAPVEYRQSIMHDHEEDDMLDPLPEGLKRGQVSSGASVQYTNKEKTRTKRTISKAMEKIDSGYVKIGSDVPKYIADELSFMAKRADVSQKDYILKLILEDMFKRDVFEEPKANT